MDITVSSDIDSEYLSLIQNILDDPEFKKLGLYTQHLKTTRLMHSINVSYISWMIARKFGLDECAAARAGLLHDFFLYGYGEKDKRDFHSCMAFDHPKQLHGTARSASISPKRNGWQFFHICFPSDLFRQAGKHGSSAAPTSSVPPWSCSRFRLLFQKTTGLWSLPSDFLKIIYAGYRKIRRCLASGFLFYIT